MYGLTPSTISVATTEYTSSLSIGSGWTRDGRRIAIVRTTIPRAARRNRRRLSVGKPIVVQFNFCCRALTRIVDAGDFFKNVINCDCLHAKIVAADRLPVVVGVHARTACDASP